MCYDGERTVSIECGSRIVYLSRSLHPCHCHPPIFEMLGRLLCQYQRCQLEVVRLLRLYRAMKGHTRLGVGSMKEIVENFQATKRDSPPFLSMAL